MDKDNIKEKAKKILAKSAYVTADYLEYNAKSVERNVELSKDKKNQLHKFQKSMGQIKKKTSSQSKEIDKSDDESPKEQADKQFLYSKNPADIDRPITYSNNEYGIAEIDHSIQYKYVKDMSEDEIDRLKSEVATYSKNTLRKKIKETKSIGDSEREAILREELESRCSKKTESSVNQIEHENASRKEFNANLLNSVKQKKDFAMKIFKMEYAEKNAGRGYIITGRIKKGGIYQNDSGATVIIDHEGEKKEYNLLLVYAFLQNKRYICAKKGMVVNLFIECDEDASISIGDMVERVQYRL